MTKVNLAKSKVRKPNKKVPYGAVPVLANDNSRTLTFRGLLRFFKGLVGGR